MGGSYSTTSDNNKSADAPNEPQDPEKFKQDVRNAANKFKTLVQDNKVLIFSATYCSYCNVAKRLFDDIGTQYSAVEVMMGEELDSFDDNDLHYRSTKWTTAPC